MGGRGGPEYIVQGPEMIERGRMWKRQQTQTDVFVLQILAQIFLVICLKPLKYDLLYVFNFWITIVKWQGAASRFVLFEYFSGARWCKTIQCPKHIVYPSQIHLFMHREQSGLIVWVTDPVQVYRQPRLFIYVLLFIWVNWLFNMNQGNLNKSSNDYRLFKRVLVVKQIRPHWSGSLNVPIDQFVYFWTINVFHN